MEIISDWRELLELFNSKGVEYVVVGGFALAFHGAPRMTGDLDLLVCPDAANAARVASAMEAFGLVSLGLSADDFAVADRVVQIGYKPDRVDILTGISGVSWADAWANRVAGRLGSVPVSFLGVSELVANKRAVGRHRDLADIESLGKGPA